MKIENWDGEKIAMGNIRIPCTIAEPLPFLPGNLQFAICNLQFSILLIAAPPQLGNVLLIVADRWALGKVGHIVQSPDCIVARAARIKRIALV